MFKENGRLKPAKDVEIAKLKEKIYKCKGCGKEKVLDRVEFAATVLCELCGGVMEII